MQSYLFEQIAFSLHGQPSILNYFSIVTLSTALLEFKSCHYLVVRGQL